MDLIQSLEAQEKILERKLQEICQQKKQILASIETQKDQSENAYRLKRISEYLRFKTENKEIQQVVADVLFDLLLRDYTRIDFDFRYHRLIVKRSITLVYEIWYEGMPESKKPQLKLTEDNDYYYPAFNFLGGKSPTSIFHHLNYNKYSLYNHESGLSVSRKEGDPMPIFILKLVKIA